MDRFTAGGRFGEDLEIRHRAQHGAHATTHQRVVVNDQDADGVRARAADARADAVEEVGGINNMRLPRAVGQHGVALGAAGRQHHIDGAAHSDHVKVDLGAPELALQHDHAVFLADLRAQRAKALEVLVNRPAAQVAAARVADPGIAVAPQQRAHEIVACAHLLAEAEGHGIGAELGRVHLHLLLVGPPFHPGAKMAQDLDQRAHVLDVGQVVQLAGMFSQQGRGDHGKGGVLAA